MRNQIILRKKDVSTLVINDFDRIIIALFGNIAETVVIFQVRNRAQLKKRGRFI